MAVSFCRTKTRAEALESTDLDCIYFPTDSATIIMGGKEYSSTGLPIEVMTLQEYNALDTKKADTVYMIRADKQDFT